MKKVIFIAICLVLYVLSIAKYGVLCAFSMRYPLWVVIIFMLVVLGVLIAILHLRFNKEG